MTGTGDADLYVRFGAEPSTGAYDCRPYRNGSNETCDLDVPSGVTQVYVMVRGYAASTYNLQVTWRGEGDGPTDPGDGTEDAVLTDSASVSTGSAKFYDNIAVVPGSTFAAQISGSGDADLYVRFGSRPTSQAYDCRPYLNGSNETCSLTVPSGVTQAFVAVNGYSAASYNLRVEYVTPAP